jgi:hypothetical protein
MGLLRFAAIAFVIYLIFRLIARFVLPLLAKYFVKKATQNMHERVQTQSEGEKIYQDEKVIIRKTNQKKANESKSNDDEFVDFEEV